MPYVKFKYKDVPLWAEYKFFDYDYIDILAITAEDSKIDLLPIVEGNILSYAIEAAKQDYRELIEYRKECQLEMREAVRTS